MGTSVEVYDKFKENNKNSLGEFVIVVEEENTNKKNSYRSLQNIDQAKMLVEVDIKKRPVKEVVKE